MNCAYSDQNSVFWPFNFYWDRSGSNGGTGVGSGGGSGTPATSVRKNRMIETNISVDQLCLVSCAGSYSSPDESHLLARRHDLDSGTE